MANVNIVDDLTALAATPAIDDYFVIVDKSNGEVKSVTTANAARNAIMSRSKFVWGDATSLLIEPGTYFCKDKYCYWNSDIDKTVDTLTDGEWYYVYLDYSAITSGTAITATEILYVTTEPAWNDTEKGWYNADDRCIFAFLADGTNTMDEFFHDGNVVVFADRIADQTATDIDTTWTDVTLTIPKFTTQAEVSFRMVYVDGTATGYWRTNGQTGAVGHSLGTVATGITYSRNTVRVHTDASQKIEIKHSASNAGTTAVDTEGWYFPTGM